jgi:tRNA modification GTPase
MAKASSSGWSSALAGGADTIVARSSAPGRGALAVVRLSGSACRELSARICPDLDFDDAWRARLVALRDAEGRTLERAVAIPYRAPISYTGEDMLELLLHGSPYLVDGVIESALAGGARPAAPGEFTRRAVANGKMDLVQAEAVRDLIEADTAWQAHNAREQLAGALSKRLRALRERLTELLARVEGTLDFAAHGVSVEADELAGRRRACHEEIDALLRTAAAGERIRGGVTIVITGPPNAGKSTLFNVLLGKERAIVASEPGTTRDVIEAGLELGGIPVTLVDTAGLRRASGSIESEGVRRARAAAAAAGALIELWPVDEPAPLDPDESRGGLPVIRLRSKADLLPSGEPPGDPGWLPVSCVTDQGMEELGKRLREIVVGEIPDLEGGVAIGRRHRRALERAAAELKTCELAEPELAAESIRWALREIEELTGEVATEEVLDEVFRAFCIGK